MPDQFVPDAVLLEILQQKQTLYGGSQSQFGALRRQTSFDLNRAATRLVSNPEQALRTTQFAVSQDYALRSSGLDPSTAFRGAPLAQYGGRSFLNTRGADLGSFTGDVGQFGGQLANFIKGGQSLQKAQQSAIAAGNYDPRVAAENYRSAESQYGSLSNTTGRGLFDTFGTLSGAQVDTLLGQTGLSVDELVGFQNRFLSANKQVREITGAPNGLAPDRGEQILSETIGQRQAANGLYNSNAAAAAASGSVAAYRTARQGQVAPTLLSGTLDPNKLGAARALAHYSTSGDITRQASQTFSQLGSTLASLVQASPQRSGVGRSGPVNYDAANPLRYLANPEVAMYGNLGFGASFGA